MKKILLVLLLLSLLTIYVPISFYPINRLLINALEDRLDAEIDCRSLKIYLWRSLVAKDVEAMGKGGFALSAENVVIDYDLISIVTGRLHAKCGLENVKFYKGGSIMNSLSDILQIKPLGNTTFKTVQADFYIGKDDTLTQNLTLLSDEIKILGNATTDKDNAIMCLLYFSIRDYVVSEIPKEIRDSLLQKEEGPWSSIYIGIMGNYKEPILRIITERFRINISSV